MNKTTYKLTDNTLEAIKNHRAVLRKAGGDKNLAKKIQTVIELLKKKTFTDCTNVAMVEAYTGKQTAAVVVEVVDYLFENIEMECEKVIESETNNEAETPVEETILVELTQTERALQSNNRKVVKKAIKATDDVAEVKALKKHLKVLKSNEITVETLEDAAKVVISIVDGDIVREERNFSLTRLGKGKAWNEFHNDNREIVISTLAAIKWQKLRETMTVTKTKEFQEAGEVLVHSYADPKYASAFEVLSKLIEINSGAADDENFTEVYGNQENWYENCMSELELTEEQRVIQLAKRCLYTHEKMHGNISKKDVSKVEYKAIEMVRDYRKPIKAF